MMQNIYIFFVSPLTIDITCMYFSKYVCQIEKKICLNGRFYWTWPVYFSSPPGVYLNGWNWEIFVSEKNSSKNKYMKGPSSLYEIMHIKKCLCGMTNDNFTNVWLIYLNGVRILYFTNFFYISMDEFCALNWIFLFASKILIDWLYIMVVL